VSQPDLTAEDLLVLDERRFSTDSVALVTGAASGIGQATALALAANGLTVVRSERAGCISGENVAVDGGRPTES
jgi:3-hydroxybutyrate dehydrogenase